MGVVQRKSKKLYRFTWARDLAQYLYYCVEIISAVWVLIVIYIYPSIYIYARIGTVSEHLVSVFSIFVRSQFSKFSK